MAFNDYKPIFAPKPWDHAVKAGLRKREGSETPAKLVITVKFAEAEKWGWKEADSLAVLLGEGEDHGMVRFKPDPEGPVILKSKTLAHGGAFFEFSLGAVAAFVDRKEATCGCNFEVLEDGWLEVVLPKWAEETSPKALAAQAATTVRKQSESPTGRREMIARAAKSVKSEPLS